MKKIITIVLAIVCFLLFGIITVCSQMADVWWWGREISFIDTALGILGFCLWAFIAKKVDAFAKQL